MTTEEFRKKYSVGTKIKFVISPVYISDECRADIGKIGKIVGYSPHDYPIIFLPESEHSSCYSTPLMPASWQTTWKSIEILPVPVKGRQLLFSFMYTE